MPERNKRCLQFVVYYVIAAFATITPTLNAALLSGPMLGHVDMREASIWLQADEPSTLSIRYHEDGSEVFFETKPVQADAERALTATIKLKQVEPGKTYNYEVLQNGETIGTTYQINTPENYYFRAPPPDFSFAVGGAHYSMEDEFEPPYQLLGGGYGIFQVIQKTSPHFMLWMGNTSHLRQSDYTTQSGILKRFTHSRSVTELKSLLASMPHYALWSHADYSFSNMSQFASYRQYSETAFKAFWPRPVEVPNLEGIASRFRYADVDFFMLDVHSYRNDTPNSEQTPQILGKKQIEWLRQELINSSATFKIILSGSPVLNPADNDKNLSYAQAEHNFLLEALRRENISGLFFISGGKYFGELTKLVHASNYNLYDLTIGPLTASPNTSNKELNYFRVPGTTTVERQFAIIEVQGPEEDRKLKIQVNSMEGDLLWNRIIPARDLQPLEELK
ncbi:MAG: alkaline phosphatase D family protein [Coraliomargaritaceae bacterium]